MQQWNSRSEFNLSLQSIFSEQIVSWTQGWLTEMILKIVLLLHLRCECWWVPAHRSQSSVSNSPLSHHDTLHHQPDKQWKHNRMRGFKQSSSEDFWHSYMKRSNSSQIFNECVNQNVVFSTHQHSGAQFSSLENLSSKLYKEHKDNMFYVDKRGTLPSHIHSQHKKKGSRGASSRSKGWNKIIKSFSLRKTNSHDVVYFEVLLAISPHKLFYHFYFQ